MELKPGSRCRVRKLEGGPSPIAELDGYLLSVVKPGETILFGQDNDLWRTSTVQKIEVAGQSYFIYTLNSVYQLEILEDENNETNS